MIVGLWSLSLSCVSGCCDVGCVWTGGFDAGGVLTGGRDVGGVLIGGGVLAGGLYIMTGAVCVADVTVVDDGFGSFSAEVGRDVGGVFCLGRGVCVPVEIALRKSSAA